MTRQYSIPLMIVGALAAYAAVLGAMLAPAPDIIWGGLLVCGAILAGVGYWWTKG